MSDWKIRRSYHAYSLVIFYVGIASTDAWRCALPLKARTACAGGAQERNGRPFLQRGRCMLLTSNDRRPRVR